MDFYEKIAGKASDPILEPLVMSVPDPFDSYGPPKEDGQIFSVLAPYVPPTPITSQEQSDDQTRYDGLYTTITESEPHTYRLTSDFNARTHRIANEGSGVLESCYACTS